MVTATFELTVAVTTNVTAVPHATMSGDPGLLEMFTLRFGAAAAVVDGLVVGALVVGAVVGALVVGGVVVGAPAGVALGVALTDGLAEAVPLALADALALPPNGRVLPGSPVPVPPAPGADGPDAVVPVPPWLFDTTTSVVPPTAATPTTPAVTAMAALVPVSVPMVRP
jgi:hypothetical protein